jgi:hypothetical protein
MGRMNPDLGTLVVEGQDAIARTTAQHSERWGLGSARRWVLDQQDGRIVWSFDDHVASAPAQILGSWNSEVGTFVWAWDNSSVAEGLAETASDVRAYGAEHDIAALTGSPLQLDEGQVRDLVALAFRIGRCTGLYAHFDGSMASYITFGEVTLEEAGGRTSTFAVSDS